MFRLPSTDAEGCRPAGGKNESRPRSFAPWLTELKNKAVQVQPEDVGVATITSEFADRSFLPSEVLC